MLHDWWNPAHHSIPLSVTHHKRSRTFGFERATYPGRLCHGQQVPLMQTHDRGMNRGSTGQVQRMRTWTEDATGTRIRKIAPQSKITVLQITVLHLAAPHSPRARRTKEPASWVQTAVIHSSSLLLPHMVQTATEMPENGLDLGPLLVVATTA